MTFHQRERLTCGTGEKYRFSGPIPINLDSTGVKSIPGYSKAGKSTDHTEGETV